MVPRERVEARSLEGRRALRHEGEERSGGAQRLRREARRLRVGGGGLRRRVRRGDSATWEPAVDGSGGDSAGVSGAGVRRVVTGMHGDRDGQGEAGVGGPRRRHANSNRVLQRRA